VTVIANKEINNVTHSSGQFCWTTTTVIRQSQQAWNVYNI